MKTLTLVCTSLALALSGFSYAGEIDKSHIQRLGPVTSTTSQPLSKGAHADALRANLVTQLTQQESVNIFGEKYRWTEANSTSDKSGWVAYQVPISTQRFTQGKLNVSGLENPQVYLNGQLVKSANEVTLTLANGDHNIMVLADGYQSDAEFAIAWQGESEVDQLSYTSQDTQRVSAQQLYDSKVISALSLSPNGDYLLQSTTEYRPETGDKAIKVTELIELDDNQVIYRWQDNRPASAVWSDDSDTLAFVANKQIQLLDVESLAIKVAATNLENVSGLQWHNNSLLFSWQKPFKADEKATSKRFQALEDRWSYWRNNSQIYQLDIASGVIRQLTDNKISSNFADNNSKNNTLLFTRHPVDYAQPAHGLTQLFELNINTLTETLMGEFRTFSGVKYADDGMYIVAGPRFMDGLGMQNPDIEVNDYDGQLYWRDNKGNISALSKDFDPSIGSITKLDNDDLIVKVTEGDRAPVYLFDKSKKRFKKLDTNMDMTTHIGAATAKSNPMLVFAGTSATVPQKAYKMKLNGSPKVIFDSQKQSYANTRLGKIEDFDFTNKHGHNIDGRVYLPADFDATKKYPALVYYYGGTSPVGRHFTGRWPFNLWAAQGYVVYVLQPNGATGYGQAFSGRHVNAWGKYSAEDIIEGTQAFLKQYDFVDPKRVGNMGASYGGFMTMYLATQTDIFAASMSHAGISNLSSYWGHGWWGYGYSGVASRGSFPWNNPELYVDQSPLYQADKITTPLLLIHGNADTNVPVGESHYMYTALKLLDKEVELVEFNDQDHHINGHNARFDWWDTTIAWFDLHLKDQPQWWNSLYPETKK
ncbi:alpha/beta hydrolase family protein [Shewanella gaetbuli]|uniref:S9 family peptidase n=1 Tax=Shewanella gaetbuli TaxID=220752 RepID=A0A9X1ZRM4_9GAMM|nr:S9 family peptidase [Shewanella gaetbuli]MCL1142828.1 S9 family peptidase [Shewanella gaetbuli]